MVDDHTGKSASIDLFFVTESNNTFYPCPTTMILFPNELFKKEETYPLSTVDFEGSVVNVPIQPLPYLYRQYGNDCLDVIKMSHIHTMCISDRMAIWWASIIPIAVIRYIHKTAV